MDDFATRYLATMLGSLAAGFLGGALAWFATNFWGRPISRFLDPSQPEMMVAALKRKQLPVGYFLFAGEQHGFRKAATIKRTLDAELYFYAATVLKTGLRF